MNRLAPIALGVGAIMTLSTMPALAQYDNEFQIAKVVKQGTTQHDIAGSGSVTVQVLVNADGTHKVTKVIKSSNPGDNAAAMDIAASSTYKPAMRGKTPVTSFYDFTLKFNGKVAVDSMAGGDNSVTKPIDEDIHASKYDDAIAKANAALAASPGNPAVLQLLGVAQYYKGDLTASAQTFAQVSNITSEFAAVAAQSFANTAVKNLQSDPAQSLAYAKRAYALDSSNNSRFALGVALIGNKQYSEAVTTLKAIDQSKLDARTKQAVDQQLLDAYLDEGDTASATTEAAALKALDPGAAAAAMGSYYLSLGNQAMNDKKYDAALKAYDQAIAAGSGQTVVTANTYAAFAVMSMDKPDYAKAQQYALAAVTAAPDDANANYAAGTATFGVFTKSQKRDDKTKAQAYLKKADDLAKAAGNTALITQIETQIKNIGP
jgi:hypothetical protein